jgi:tetratricopeptide (TPR) repeat protein
MRLLVSLLCATVLSSTNARACINDRDSDALAVQAQKLPDALRVITGRFERNPPRYYQMRAARVQAELAKNPRQLALYDDLGAALDRLGKSDEALRWMNRKRDLLPPYNAKDSANKEAWYRFYANAGTFRAHRWLHDGANVKTIDEMKSAREFIKRAIQIKPNAHFGREKYQLMAMDWIVSTKTKKTQNSLGTWIEMRDRWEFDSEEDPDTQIAAKQARRREAIEGLSGLVVWAPRGKASMFSRR